MSQRKATDWLGAVATDRHSFSFLFQPLFSMRVGEAGSCEIDGYVFQGHCVLYSVLYSIWILHLGYNINTPFITALTASCNKQ